MFGGLYIETLEVLLDGLPSFRLYLVYHRPIITVGQLAFSAFLIRIEHVVIAAITSEHINVQAGIHASPFECLDFVIQARPSTQTGR